MRPRADALAAGLLVALTAGPTPAAPAGGFYARDAEGWFWYREPPVPAPITEQPSKPVEESPSEPVAASPPAPEPIQAPAPLSAHWFREHLDTYRDRAIDDPSPENVAVYLHLQRIAMDKSTRFARVSERVVQGDPVLDEITRRPTANFGANLADKQASAAGDALLERLAGETALWFFFRSDCPYCDAQAPLLEALAQRYGFAVLAVSLDGAGLADGTFPAFDIDRGQAEALGVISTPAMFLARPDQGAVAPIAQGLLSLAQLRDRIVLAAVQAGWVNEAEASRLRAGPADARSAAATLSALPEDPRALLEALRATVLPDTRPDSSQAPR
ncbi:conjugal transfer protein TraF [Thiocapsa roseopersicina]|uniref:Conjugal transfer pilus assembly protein TraF n=1 Tax=Thiocapsa roseopersicina TaxID=1058 RepID=A0A1H2YD55_THIRO|nr:conjugal transfer protein TraF [Thiocapsa roseopersicina]SDX02594.1 conjugal transfer pilus assembly protein TraF [Thiocapsa roseopersicina]